jgi:hypothetical protein
VQLIPAWIDNVQRVMPKGEVVPVPILCTVTFGAPMQLQPGEDKRDFLSARATRCWPAAGPELMTMNLHACAPLTVDQQVALLFVALFGVLLLLPLACRWCARCDDDEQAQRDLQLRRDLRAVWVGAVVFWVAGSPGRWAPRWPSACSRSWRCASSSRWRTRAAATTAA